MVHLHSYRMCGMNITTTAVQHPISHVTVMFGQEIGGTLQFSDIFVWAWGTPHN